jgi:hypothetical protein
LVLTKLKTEKGRWKNSSTPSFTSLFFDVRSKCVFVVAKSANDEGVSSAENERKLPRTPLPVIEENYSRTSCVVKIEMRSSQEYESL